MIAARFVAETVRFLLAVAYYRSSCSDQIFYDRSFTSEYLDLLCYTLLFSDITTVPFDAN